VLFRFNGPIIFFSASYFKREVQRAASAAGAELKWLVIDLLPVNMVDATGLYAIQEVFEDLRARGIVAGAAARATEWADWAAERGFDEALGRTRFFSTLQQAVEAFADEVGARAR
jgi:MFS superfamily sulfate permease-like transporter